MNGGKAYLHFSEKSGRPTITLEQGSDTFTFQVGKQFIFVRKNGEPMIPFGLKSGELVQEGSLEKDSNKEKFKKCMENVVGDYTNVEGYSRAVFGMLQDINPLLLDYKTKVSIK